MERYRAYNPLDDVPEGLGDSAFMRLDMQSDPATLPPGSVQASENMRFDTTGPQVRGGLAPQFRPGTFLGPIVFAGVYRPDASNDRWALVTTHALVLFNPADQSTQAYYFPSGEICSAPVDLVQAGISTGTLPDLYILRGTDKTTLKFDGASVTVAASFQKAAFGLFEQDRIAAASGTQTMMVSDFLDFTVWTQLNQFKILYGSDDYLVGFLPYQNDKVIIGTRKRFFIAYFDPATSTGGYSGGLVTATSFLRSLTREAGPVGRFAMKEAAGKIWFITDRAIYAFVPQLDLELTVLGKPISADIQPVMDRMSANYASSAAIEHYGYRLYFALPIADAPVSIVGATIQQFQVRGIDLPFDLPAALAVGSIATVQTGSPHGAKAGDLEQVSGMIDALLNGVFAVLSVPDATHFTVGVDAPTGTATGDQAKAQRLATRNNVIAVYNLNFGAWESIDRLPSGIYADRLLAADYGAQRRLWIVDQTLGPALYEEAMGDITGDIAGGNALPFDLPVDLSSGNFASVSVPGRLKSRRLRVGRWSPNSSYNPFSQHIRAGQARLSTAPGDQWSVTLTVHTPGRPAWSKTRAGTQVGEALGRIRSGRRGIEAELEVNVTNGRPVVRALELEVTEAGRSAES